MFTIYISLDQRKETKIRWLEDPNQSNVDNLNNVRCKAIRHFKNKKKEYLKFKVNELETNSKIKSIRDLYRSINDFRTDIVRDEKDDLVTDFHSILARWRNHFSQLFTVHGVNGVRQRGRHTAEPLMPEPSVFEFEMAFEKLKRHKTPDIDQIPAELIKARGRTIRSEIHTLINFIWNKEELTEEWKESIIVPIY